MNTKNFNFLFSDPDNFSNDWDKKFFYLLKENNKTELLYNILTASNLYIEEYTICSFIHNFTKNFYLDFDEKQFLTSLTNRSHYIKDVKINNSTLNIETINGTINVGILSDLIPTFEKEYPDIKTDNRLGKCHEKSIEISKKLGKKNNVVTGYCYGISDKSKYLHSWIETSINKKQVVIDYTQNAIINKKGYYMLNHATPLCRIADKDIISDQYFLNKLSKVIPLSNKEYLVFRNEIMSDLKKSNISFDDDNSR